MDSLRSYVTNAAKSSPESKRSSLFTCNLYVSISFHSLSDFLALLTLLSRSAICSMPTFGAMRNDCTEPENLMLQPRQTIQIQDRQTRSALYLQL